MEIKLNPEYKVANYDKLVEILEKQSALILDFEKKVDNYKKIIEKNYKIKLVLANSLISEDVYPLWEAIMEIDKIDNNKSLYHQISSWRKQKLYQKGFTEQDIISFCQEMEDEMEDKIKTT